MDKSEIIKKAAACSTAEELQTLAKEYGMDMDLEQAALLLKDFNKKNTEISDDELDMVAGGGCGGGGGDDRRTCPICDNRKGEKWMKIDNKTWYRCTSCNIFFIEMK